MVRKINTIIKEISSEMQQYLGVTEEQMEASYPKCNYQSKGIYSSVAGNCLLNDLPVEEPQHVKMYEEVISSVKGDILDMNGGVGVLVTALNERKGNNAHHFDVNFHLQRFVDKILNLKTFRSINSAVMLKYDAVIYLHTHHNPTPDDIISTAYNCLRRNGLFILSKDMKDVILKAGYYNFEGLLKSVGFELIDEQEHIYIFRRVR